MYNISYCCCIDNVNIKGTAIVIIVIEARLWNHKLQTVLYHIQTTSSFHTNPMWICSHISTHSLKCEILIKRVKKKQKNQQTKISLTKRFYSINTNWRYNSATDFGPHITCTSLAITCHNIFLLILSLTVSKDTIGRAQTFCNCLLLSMSSIFISP